MIQLFEIRQDADETFSVRSLRDGSIVVLNGDNMCGLDRQEPAGLLREPEKIEEDLQQKWRFHRH